MTEATLRHLWMAAIAVVVAVIVFGSLVPQPLLPGGLLPDKASHYLSYFTLALLGSGITTPERLWRAITDPEMREKYTFGVGVLSEWTPGSRYEGIPRQLGFPIVEGENLEVDPPRRLVQSFNALWSDDVKREGTSRVTWEIEQIQDSCRLVVTHDQLRERANEELYGGWPMVLSGLKTLLETGERLTTPGSLMYGEPQEGAATWAELRNRASR